MSSALLLNNLFILQADQLNGFKGNEYDAENIYQEITEDRFAVPSKKDVYLMDERIYHEPHIPLGGPHASRTENLYSVCCVSNPPLPTVNVSVQGRDFPPTGQFQYQSRLTGLASPELRARKPMPHHFDPGKCQSSQTQDGSVLRCEHCTYCLLDFKRQLIQIINSDIRFAKVSEIIILLLLLNIMPYLSVEKVKYLVYCFTFADYVALEAKTKYKLSICYSAKYSLIE